MRMSKVWIEVWQDQKDTNRPWIVSLEDGKNSTTLAVYPDLSNASAYAEEEACKRGCSCYAPEQR